MKKFFDVQSGFLIVAIVLGLLLNRTNCNPDPDCDPDPIYGGCSSNCEYGTTTQWITKSFGLWILLNIGDFLGKENLKKKTFLRKFIDENGLKYTINEINEELTLEDTKHDIEIKKLLKSMKNTS